MIHQKMSSADVTKQVEKIVESRTKALSEGQVKQIAQDL
jgi:hypothetical protein